jgi:hypothetical protein
LCHYTWLARYPRPQFIFFDDWKMGEFKREFKQMCDNYGIKDKQTTSHNPQANAPSDNGGKFKIEFKQMYDNYGIKAKSTTSHNQESCIL